LIRSWWQLLPVVTAAAMLPKVDDVLPGF